MRKPSQAPLKRAQRLLKRLNPFHKPWRPHVVTPSDEPRMETRLLFICGLHRSGTTLIEAWIRAACEVSALRAPVSENEGEHLQDVYPRADLYGGPGRFAFHPTMHPQTPAPEEAVAARARLLACWTPWIKGDETLLLEKSPPNLTKIRWLRAVFPGARFIIVTRDPRVVSMATQKWSGGTLTDLLYHWHVAHSAALDALEDDCVCLRYEDFCAAPEEAIDRIVSALGIARRTPLPPLRNGLRKTSSSNGRYLDQWPGTRLGHGAWEEFGYALGP